MGAQVGAFGNLMEWFGANPTFNKVTILNTGRNLKQWDNFDDFLDNSVANASGIWLAQLVGAGAGFVFYPGTATRPGQRTLSTGTTNVGTAAMYTLGAVAGILFGGGQYTFEIEVYIGNLSTAIEEYVSVFGFGDSGTAEPTDGAYFYYDRAGAGVNWRLKTANNGVRTDTDSTVAVAAGAYIKLKVVVNYAGNLVSYYINGVLVGTNNANIPVAGGRETGALISIIKTVGATARLLYLDWAWLHFDLTATR
jgi:hypothetical protein